MRAQTIQGERSPLSLTEHCCPTKLATDLPGPSAETSWSGVVQWCENSPDPQVWKIPGASIRGHQSRAPICSHCLQAGKSLAACGGAAAALPQPRWELGWVGLGIAKHPSCTFKSRHGFPPAAGLWGGKYRKGAFDLHGCLHLVTQGW